MDSAPAANPSSLVLPCAVQVGFSGARRLFMREGLTDLEVTKIETAITEGLVRELAGLRSQLGLGAHHFLCGISQIAIGGDFHFTRACANSTSGMSLQRIFLAQPVDAYLDAIGSKGPDFSPQEKLAARALLDQPHIVHVQGMSNADTRSERFQDVARAIIAESDVAVCLVPPAPKGAPGGSQEFVELAAKREVPLLLIEVTIAAGKPVFQSTWHNREKAFKPPALPVEVAALPDAPTMIGTTPPGIEAYCKPLKSHFSKRAGMHRSTFESAARIIVTTHIGATICATIALAVSSTTREGAWAWLLAGLLVAELILLGRGFFTHHRLNHDKRAHQWAADRLGAEILRSVGTLHGYPMHLAHLFRLRPPPRPGWPSLLATLNLLHLRSAKKASGVTAKTRSADYIKQRLDAEPPAGQIQYYLENAQKADRQFAALNLWFERCWGVAVVATSAKFLFLALDFHGVSWGSATLGTFAVVFPLLAVGALTWASAQDYAARASTYREMLGFLEGQRKALVSAFTDREVRRLILETETGLLGETAEWHARRAFTTIA